MVKKHQNWTRFAILNLHILQHHKKNHLNPKTLKESKQPHNLNLEITMTMLNKIQSMANVKKRKGLLKIKHLVGVLKKSLYLYMHAYSMPIFIKR